MHVESLLKLSPDAGVDEESKDEGSLSLGAVDEAIAARVRAASERGNILRYMITVDADGVSDARTCCRWCLWMVNRATSICR